MSDILVAYDCVSGSTADVALIIAEELRGRDRTVDVVPVAEVGSLSSYRTVLVGSPMRFGGLKKVLPGTG